MNVYPDDSLCSKRDHSQRFVSLPFERIQIRTMCVGESRTQQDHHDSTDINQIVARFSRSGVLPVGRGPGQYLDVTDLQTSDTASHLVQSREVLAEARNKVAANRAAARKAAEDKLKAEQAELEAFRKAAADRKQAPPAG